MTRQSDSRQSDTGPSDDEANPDTDLAEAADGTSEEPADDLEVGEPVVDLGSFIREQRRLAQLSVRKLSERAGISNPYLSQIERGLRRPSAEILQQLAVALEISSESLYTKAGILDEKVGSRPDVMMAIRSDPALDEADKKALIHMYQSLRKAGSDEAEAEAAADADAAEGDPIPPPPGAPGKGS